MADKTPEELKADSDAAAKASQLQAEQDRRDIAAAPATGPVLPISMTPAGSTAPKTDQQVAAQRAIDDEKMARDKANQKPGPLIAPADPVPATDRIRAFEDEVFKDSQVQVVRIGGRLERGTGSAFAALSPELRRQHAALEKLVESEQKLADSKAALVQAETDHETALAAAEPRPDAPANE